MLSRTPTAAPETLGSILKFAEHQARGAAERLVRGVLGAWPPDGPDARVPAADVPRLLTAAAEMTGDAAFALRLAEAGDPRRFGVLAYTITTSGTLAEAYGHAARFLGLWNEGMTLSVVTGEGGSAGGVAAGDRPAR